MRHDHWRDSGAGVANGNALLAGPLEWTHPQILTGATVKREIVPAPGAGLILIPSRLIVLQNFGVAYTQARWWSAWFATQNLFQANTIDTQTVGIAIDNMDDAPSYGALTAEARLCTSRSAMTGRARSCRSAIVSVKRSVLILASRSRAAARDGCGRMRTRSPANSAICRPAV